MRKQGRLTGSKPPFVLGQSSMLLPKLGLKDASVQQAPFPCNDPLLFVIPSAAEGPAVRHSCAPLLPATTSTTHRRILVENTTLPFVIPGLQEWSAEPQIPRLRSAGFQSSLRDFSGAC